MTEERRGTEGFPLSCAFWEPVSPRKTSAVFSNVPGSWLVLGEMFPSACPSLEAESVRRAGFAKPRVAIRAPQVVDEQAQLRVTPLHPIRHHVHIALCVAAYQKRPPASMERGNKPGDHLALSRTEGLGITIAPYAQMYRPAGSLWACMAKICSGGTPRPICSLPARTSSAGDAETR